MIRLTVAQIAEKIEGRVEGDPGLEITGVAPLGQARPGQISFLTSRKEAAGLKDTGASAAIVDLKVRIPEGLTVIRSDNPNVARARASWLFVDRPVEPGRVMDGAHVEPSAEIGSGATIYPLAYVGAGALIGAGAVIHPHVYIGPEVKVGEGTVIWPQAVLYPGVSVGRGCIIHAGVVLGADGFGFAQTALGEHVKIPQVGDVAVGDDVEIGANTCIDRAAFGTTSVADGVKMDNLVQIGHNTSIGRSAVVVSQVGISGSVKVGANTVIGGQAGVADHLTIGDRVFLAADSKVITDLPDDFKGGGTPALPAMQARRIIAGSLKIPEMIQQVKDVDRRLTQVEKSLTGDKED